MEVKQTLLPYQSVSDFRNILIVFLIIRLSLFLKRYDKSIQLIFLIVKDQRKYVKTNHETVLLSYFILLHK